MKDLLYYLSTAVLQYCATRWRSTALTPRYRLDSPVAYAVLSGEVVEVMYKYKIE